MALIGSLAGSMIGSAGAGGVMQALGGGAAAISAARMVGGMAGGSMVNAITSRPQARSIPQPPAQPSRPTINYTPMLNSIISGLQGITVRIESSNAYLKQLVQLNSPATVNNYNNNVINRFVTALNGSILGRLTGKQYFEEFNRKYSDMMRHWGDQLEKKTVNNFELIAYKLMGNGSLLGRVFSGNAPFMDKMTKSLQSYGRSSSTFDNNTRTTIVDVIPRHLKTIADYTIVTANNTANLIHGTKKASVEIEEQIKIINRSQKNNQSLLQNEFNSVKEEFRKSISISGAFFNIMRNHLTWIPKIGASILLFKGAGWLANQLGLTPLLKNFGTKLYAGAKSLVSGMFNSPVFKGALDRLGTTIVNGIYKALMWYASFQGAKRLSAKASDVVQNFSQGVSIGVKNDEQKKAYIKKLSESLNLSLEEAENEAKVRIRRMMNTRMGRIGNIVGVVTGGIGRFLVGILGKIGAAMNTVTLAIQIGSLVVNAFRVLVSKAFDKKKKGPLTDADIVGYIIKKLYAFTNKFMKDLGLAIGFVIRNAVPLLKGIVVSVFKSLVTFVANILYETGIDVFKRMAKGIASSMGIELGEGLDINKKSLNEQITQTKILNKIREATDEMNERLNPKVLMGGVFRLLGSLHNTIGKITSNLTKGKVDLTQSMYGAATNITRMTGNANMGAAYLSRFLGFDKDLLNMVLLRRTDLEKGTTSEAVKGINELQNQKNEELQQQQQEPIGDAIDSNVSPDRLRNIIQQAIITAEGRKQTTYYDVNGYLIGGIGHKITKDDKKLGYTKDKIGLSNEIINRWFVNDFNRAYDISSNYSFFNGLSDPRKAAIVDLAFHSMLQRSPKMREYLYNNRLSQAADELLNSKVGRGGNGKGAAERLHRNAYALKYNIFDTEYQGYKNKYLQNSNGTNTSKGAILKDIGKYLRLAPDLDSGSLTNLHPELLSRLYEYSKLYYEKHGKRVVLNSGFRTFAKQQQLYNDWKANKMPNTPIVVEPGTSNHEKGLAVDISNKYSPIDAALLKRVGLIRPVRGEGWHVELPRLLVKGSSPVNVTASTQNVGTGGNLEGVTQTSGGNDVFDNFINMFKIFTGLENPYESVGDAPVDFTVNDVLSSVTNRIKNSMIGKESILFKGQAELASENNQEQGKLIGKQVVQPMEKMSEKIAQNLGSVVSTMAKTMISVGMPTINQITTNTNTSNISSSSVSNSEVSNGQESTSLDKIDNYDFGLSAFMI